MLGVFFFFLSRAIVELELDKQILAVCSQSEPSRDEHVARADLLSRVRGFVAELWPDAHLFVYGSAENGLALKGGDIDLTILFPVDFVLDAEDAVKRVADILTESNFYCYF